MRNGNPKANIGMFGLVSIKCISPYLVVLKAAMTDAS